ncbi:MAG: hypothetical protein HY794_18210 [Desulfarculus sp.]|nr:hypothetical protein [Desulfarculus sp.]
MIEAEKAVKLKAIEEMGNADGLQAARTRALETETNAQKTAAAIEHGRHSLYLRQDLQAQIDMIGQSGVTAEELRLGQEVAHLRRAHNDETQIVAYEAKRRQEIRETGTIAARDAEAQINADSLAAAVAARGAYIANLVGRGADEVKVLQEQARRKQDLERQHQEALAGFQSLAALAQGNTTEAILAEERRRLAQMEGLQRQGLASWSEVQKQRVAVFIAEGDNMVRYSVEWFQRQERLARQAVADRKKTETEAAADIISLRTQALQQHQRLLDAFISYEKARLRLDLVEGWRVALEEILAQQKSWGELTNQASKDTYAAMTDALQTGLVDIAKGKYEDLASVADSFFDAILRAWMRMLAEMISAWAAAGIAGLFDIKLPAFGGGISLGGGGGVAGALGTGASLISTAKTVGGWLGIGGAGAGLGGASGFAGSLAAEQSAEVFATMISNGKTVEEALAAIGGGNGGIMGGIKGAFDSAIAAVKSFTGVTEAGAVAVETGAAATEAASLGLSTTLAWVGGALAVGELLGKLTGGVGPVGAVMELLSGGSGHTQGSARQYEQLSIDAIGRMSSGLDLGHDLSGGVATGQSLADILRHNEDMRLLGERAGLTTHQVDLLTQGIAGLERQMIRAAQHGNQALVDSLKQDMAELQKVEMQTGINTAALGPMSGAFAQIAQIMDTMVQPAFDDFGAASQGSIIEADSAVHDLAGSLSDMADSMGLPRDATEGFKAKVVELVDQWNTGDLSVGALAERLQNQFMQALQGAALEGFNLDLVMQGLKASIESIPGEKVIKFVYEGQDLQAGGGDIGGGIAGDMPRMHDGGWPRLHGGLAPDEFPAILQAGEVVFSKRNVASAGGPQAVEAIRRGEGGAQRVLAPVFNLTVNGGMTTAQARQLGDEVWRQFSRRYQAGERLGAGL